MKQINDAEYICYYHKHSFSKPNAVKKIKLSILSKIAYLLTLCKANFSNKPDRRSFYKQVQHMKRVEKCLNRCAKNPVPPDKPFNSAREELLNMANTIYPRVKKTFLQKELLAGIEWSQGATRASDFKRIFKAEVAEAEIEQFTAYLEPAKTVFSKFRLELQAGRTTPLRVIKGLENDKNLQAAAWEVARFWDNIEKTLENCPQFKETIKNMPYH
jgi:hypothetical protein